MKRTAIVMDSRFRDHEPGPGHPERPERIGALEGLIHDWPGPALERVDLRLATHDELERVHCRDLVRTVQATAGEARSQIDADTSTSPLSYETALLASGALLNLIDAVYARDVENGFAFVRPPGHHATRDRSMGFCLFNNVAVAASYLRQAHGLDRIAIVDWDLHHGNGTQAIFYDDPNVLYISLHQYPFYPGTGAASEIGRGEGTGYTVNIPFSAGVGDAGFLAAFDQVIEPVLRQFEPQFVLVSAGFDCHSRDPLGHLEVTERGFVAMARSLLRVAGDVAGGRLAAVLEGGYDLTAIRSSAEVVLEQMTHRDWRGEAPEDAGAAFEPIKQILRPHWRL